MSDEVCCLVDGVVERVRTDRLVVSVSNIDTRNPSDSDKRGVVTPGTKTSYSIHTTMLAKLSLFVVQLGSATSSIFGPVLSVLYNKAFIGIKLRPGIATPLAVVG